MTARKTFADLVKAAEQKNKPKFELVEKTEPTAPIPPTPDNLSKLKPVAPEKDFSRVANSIVREAVASGSFIGKSKQIYDYLYFQTRGAVTPKRNIRITKSALMRGAGIGSERTLLKNLGHLKSLGLVNIIEHEGQHAGNEYEIFLPEEVFDPPHPPYPRYPPQKVGWVPPVESGVGGVGQTLENKAIYTDPKTSSLKTLNTDDEKSVLTFLKILQKAAKKVTGKELTSKDFAALQEIANILVAETEVARSRTTSVSIYLKFAAANLRRRLEAKPKDTSVRKKKPVDVPRVTGDEIEPLGESRNTVLKNLQEIQDERGKEAVEAMKGNYTSDDWAWLIKNIT